MIYISDPKMKFKQNLNIYLVFLYFLLIYLSFQAHEAGHWLIATLLFYEVIVTPLGVYLILPGNNLEMLAITIVGPLIGIIITIFGVFLLSKKEDLFLKRLGFFLIFIQSFGGLLQELSMTFGIISDQQVIALLLNISEWYIRIPFIIFFMGTSGLLLKDTSTGYRNIKWLFFFAILFILSIIFLLLFEYFTWQQIYLGNVLFLPILGFSGFLLVVNIGFVLLALLLFRRSRRLVKEQPPLPQN